MPESAGITKSLAGTWGLTRLIVRRDRIAFAIWIAALGLLPLAIAASFDGLYPNAEARESFAATIAGNPVTTGMLGHIFDSSLGGLVAWRVGVMSWLLMAIPSLVFVIRHTRAEEDSDRRELLGANVVGRNAPLTAALVVVLAANLLIALIVAVGLSAYGLPAGGAVALGLSFAMAGGIFAAVGAVAAQVTEGAGGARSLSLVVFAVFFLIRLVGDTSGEGSGFSWISWASPLAWTRFTQPFADERWWVFALIGAFIVVVATFAYAQSARRDLGSGLIPSRPGPAVASHFLNGPLSLAWRLQRGFLIGCAVGFAVIGLLLGFVAYTAVGLLDTPALDGWLAGIGADDAGDGFLVWIIYILAQVSSAYCVVAALRLRSEEASGLADPLLSSPVSRLRWAASHLALAVLGPVVLLAALGFGAGLAYAIAVGDIGKLPEILADTMVKLPAVWVVGGIAFAAYGLIPRIAAYVGWGALAVFLILEFGWEVGQVSDAVFDISPFAYVHPIAGDVTASTLTVLIVLAALLITVGMVGLRRRDLAA